MGYEFGLSRRIYGVVMGVVTKNDHPEGFYRVQVKFPWIQSTDDPAKDKADYVSSWARVASPMAGKGRGFYNLPEVGDEVVVSFIHGDIRFPIVLGSTWNEKDKMPVGDNAPKASTDPLGNDLGIDKTCKDNKALSGKNTSRFWNARNGSTLLFDDTDGKEKIAVFTKKGSMLAINDEKDVIAIYDADKKVYMTLDGKNKKVTIFSKGDIHVLCKDGEFHLEAKTINTKASQTQEHKSGTAWKQESGSTMDMKAGGDMTLKGGPNINLN
ncbi:MAG: phage baseplate assembly protein V [Myxococcota bacterium]